MFSKESLDSFYKSACNTEYVSFSLVGIVQSILEDALEEIMMDNTKVNNKEVFDVGNPRQMVAFKEIRGKHGKVLYVARSSSVRKDVLKMKCTLFVHGIDLFRMIRNADNVNNEHI
jgi:hypothetical protein